MEELAARNRPATRANLPKRTAKAYGPRMRFKVLGPLRVTHDDGPISLGGPKQRAVLAHLLARANDLVPVDAAVLCTALVEEAAVAGDGHPVLLRPSTSAR